MMQKMRVKYSEVEPDASKPLYAMGDYLKKSAIEQPLRDLIYIRASQLNGCAYCLDMHTQDASASGQSEQKVSCVSVWRDSPFFSKREKAALELTEALTRLSERPFSEDVYRTAREEFNDHEYVALIMAVNVINCWNRLMISCGGTAGMYSNRELKERVPDYFSPNAD